jgi:hypothetical protein
MTSLEVLLLDNNFLTGTLPAQLTRLKRLQRLNVAQQGKTVLRSFAGSIKVISRLLGLATALTWD